MKRTTETNGSTIAVHIFTEPDAMRAESLRGVYQRPFAAIPRERAEAPEDEAVPRWGEQTLTMLQTP